MSTLEHAIALAARAHQGHADKAGEPYILHPLRVALRLTTTEERIVAALHDVVEDSDWTIEGLRAEGFSESVLRAVDALTRREGEDYFAYVRRAASDPLARTVKLADLADNLDRTRIASPGPADEVRRARYLAALGILGAPAGDES